MKQTETQTVGKFVNFEQKKYFSCFITRWKKARSVVLLFFFFFIKYELSKWIKKKQIKKREATAHDHRKMVAGSNCLDVMAMIPLSVESVCTHSQKLLHLTDVFHYYYFFFCKWSKYSNTAWHCFRPRYIRIQVTELLFQAAHKRQCVSLSLQHQYYRTNSNAISGSWSSNNGTGLKMACKKSDVMNSEMWYLRDKWTKSKLSFQVIADSLMNWVKMMILGCDSDLQL